MNQVVTVAQDYCQPFPRNFKHARPAVARRGPDTPCNHRIRKDPHDKVHDPVAGKVLESISEAGRIGQIVGYHRLVGRIEGVP